MSGEAWQQLRFDNCQVPKNNILLGEGGDRKQISGFNIELNRHDFHCMEKHGALDCRGA